MKTKEIIFNPARYEAEQRRHVAGRMVADALRDGRLIRPDHCPRCGEPEQKFRNGRTNIEGHHHDYSKPLEVEWMCRTCHRNEQKEFNRSNPIPEPVDNPELKALRDAVLSDDWERRPAKRNPPRPSLDKQESQQDFYPPHFEEIIRRRGLRRWLGEWQNAHIKRKRGLSASAWGITRTVQTNDYSRSPKPKMTDSTQDT